MDKFPSHTFGGFSGGGVGTGGFRPGCLAHGFISCGILSRGLCPRIGRERCRRQSKSMKFVTSCDGHFDGMKTDKRKLNSFYSETTETFQTERRSPFTTVDVKRLIVALSN